MSKSPGNVSRLFLTGYRGTGKTSVAGHLARLLGWDAVDADDEIERRAGKTIAEMFATSGEPAFRDLEAAVVADLSNLERTVVSLGGGAVLRAESRQRIVAAGPVIWLTASAETLAARIAGDAATANRRPNLTATGGQQEIERLLAEREPLYRECATLVLETEGLSPEQLAEQIGRWIETPYNK